MPESPSNRAPLVVLSGALGAALLVIAFLLGRESARAPATVEAEVPAPGVPGNEVAAVAEETEGRRWPEWADLQDWEDVQDAQAYGGEPVAVRIERRPDGSVLLSNRQNAAGTPRATSHSPADEPESAMSAYFLEMDVIRSEAGAGDPNAFAMDLIKAAMGGSTAGFDQLIADAQRMEQEARQVTPPLSCEGYHQANLDALAESQAVLEAMKDAIASRDIARLATVAQRAGALQTKAKALQDMRERIYADAQR